MPSTGAEAVDSAKRWRSQNSFCSMDGAVFLILIIPLISGVRLVSSREICFIGSQYDPPFGNQFRWLLHPDDPCRCTAIRLEGMIVHNTPYGKGATDHLKELILSEDASEIQAFFKCSAPKNECLNLEPLGLADGSIPDECFGASSHFAYNYASNARLNRNGYWQPSSFANCWIEVDLVNSTLVSGIITQGSTSSNIYRVKRYNVKYQSSNASVYDYVKDGDGHIQVFNGNIDDATTPVTNFFHNSIMATVVRLEPVQWSAGVALRFELLRCNLN